MGVCISCVGGYSKDGARAMWMALAVGTVIVTAALAALFYRIDDGDA